MSFREKIDDFIKEQPRARLIAGGVILVCLLGVVLLHPYDQDYYLAVEEEIPLAMAICESSAEWVRENPERLKMNADNLRHILVNGKEVKLKHIKYPRAIILHDGFAHSSAQIEIYCTFKDPRGGGNKTYFFDYRRAAWVDKTLSRR